MLRTLTKEIGIDMGHRVPYHASKCKNPHGHRYTIIAECEGDIIEEGEQSGMLIDFGFLKEEMMELIDKPYDHSFTYFAGDVLMRTAMAEAMAQGMKINEVDFIPTAENLAEHWFKLLKERVTIRSNGACRLLSLKVWETPTSSATYSE